MPVYLDCPETYTHTLKFKHWVMSLALHHVHGQNLSDEKTATLGVRVTLNQSCCYGYQSADGSTFLNLFSNKHCLVQFLVKLWASTANIKGIGVLQTFTQSENESRFQHNFSIIFCLNVTLRSLYCNLYGLKYGVLIDSDPNKTNSIV